MTKDKWQGHIAILATNIIFGLNTPIAKTLVPQWISPFALTLLRMSFGAIIFWLISLFMANEKVSKRDLGILCLGGLFGLVGAQLTFATSLTYTSPVNISLIAAMTPLVVMLLAAIILKEPITSKKAAGVFVGISGALLIIFQSAGNITKPGNMTGIFFCIMNASTYAFYLVITRSVSQRYKPVTLMKWMFLFSAIVSIPFGYTDLMNAKVFSAVTEPSALIRIAYVVIMATGVAYFLVPMALKRIRPTTASMYNNAQPIIASSVAILIGQDTLTWDKPVAALLVFAGVYLVTQSKSKEDIEKAEKMPKQE